MLINELHELLTVIDRSDLETATDDELIDTKRELQKMLEAVESHLMSRREDN